MRTISQLEAIEADFRNKLLPAKEADFYKCFQCEKIYTKNDVKFLINQGEATKEFFGSKFLCSITCTDYSK